MNLVDLYGRLFDVVPGNCVKIEELPDNRSNMYIGSSKKEVKIGECYIIESVTKCSARFACAATCTTRQQSIIVQVPVEGRVEPMLLSTCNHKLTTINGGELSYKQK